MYGKSKSYYSFQNLMDEKGKRVFPEYKWGERADHVRVTISAAGYDAVCLTVERCLLASASARRLAAGGQANCVATFRPEGYATITASSPKAGEFFVIELDLAGDILEEGCSLQEPPASARTKMLSLVRALPPQLKLGRFHAVAWPLCVACQPVAILEAELPFRWPD